MIIIAVILGFASVENSYALGIMIHARVIRKKEVTRNVITSPNIIINIEPLENLVGDYNNFH